jgi:hypothetical protein
VEASPKIYRSLTILQRVFWNLEDLCISWTKPQQWQSSNQGRHAQKGAKGQNDTWGKLAECLLQCVYIHVCMTMLYMFYKRVAKKRKNARKSETESFGSWWERSDRIKKRRLEGCESTAGGTRLRGHSNYSYFFFCGTSFFVFLDCFFVFFPRKKNQKKGYHEPPGHPLDWLLAPHQGQ